MFSRFSKNINALLIFACLLAWASGSFADTSSQDSKKIHWQGWTEDLFERAQRENKFVLLDLEAVWCHWCHVMEDVTYQNELVIDIINRKYIAVRVDQESNPALASRYEDYGWPATIVFSSDGNEIVTRSGYMDPLIMASLLQAIIDDPSPGPSIMPKVQISPSKNAFLSKQQSEKHLENFNSVYDDTYGGWSTLHKFIDADSMEYAISRAAAGDKKFMQQSIQTLNSGLRLIDPVWGGAYQYSDAADWNSPHFEKIMSFQRDYLKIYSLAYAHWGDEKYLQAAQSTYEYLINFMTSPEGAFYVSQDADLNKDIDGHAYYALDDKARRKLGMPRIDKAIYSRENAWAIQGLLALYNVTHDPKILQRSLKATNYIVENFLIAGGFKHQQQDSSAAYLSDNIAMAQAMMALYSATGDRAWLQKTESTVKFINRTFKDTLNEKNGSGFISAVERTNRTGVFLQPVKKLQENVELVRLLNILYHYTGNDFYLALSKYGMRYLASPDIEKTRRFLINLLLVDNELAKDPVHIIVVGAKSSEKSKRLHQAGRFYPAQYKRLEWWDRKDGPLPNSDIQYPTLDYPAVFACSDNRCSLPITDAGKLPKIISGLYR